MMLARLAFMTRWNHAPVGPRATRSITPMRSFPMRAPCRVRATVSGQRSAESPRVAPRGRSAWRLAHGAQPVGFGRRSDLAGSADGAAGALLAEFGASPDLARLLVIL